jgi:hypothetical protein
MDALKRSISAENAPKAKKASQPKGNGHVD